MTTIKKAAAASKGFVSNHKTILAFAAGVAATAAAVVAMSKVAEGSEMNFEELDVPTEV